MFDVVRMLLRMLLLIPLGIYEIILLIVVSAMCLIKPLHPIANVLMEHAQKLPSMNWYLGRGGANDNKH